MAVTVSAKNYLLINACESLTGWAGMVDALVTDFFKQGSNCIGMELWAAGDSEHTLTGSWNLSGTKHIHLWWMTTCLNELNTEALGGMQIGVSDGTNTGYYYVAGGDTYPGGWYNPCVDLSRPVDAGIKPDMSVITAISLKWNLTASAKKVQSCWIDHLYISDGLIAYGDIDSGLITCNVVASAGTFTRTAGDFTTDGFRVGQRITTSGFTNAGNNTTKIISAVTATVITVTDNSGLVDENGDGDERVRGFFDLTDILAADENTSNGWGIIRKISGQYFLVGSIDFGDSVGTANCKFQDKSQVVVFEDRKVNSGLYAFTIVDNGTGTTEFILGSKAGTAGIEGCVIRVADTSQVAKFKIDGGTDTNVDNFKLYGSTFLEAATLKFPNDATNVEILNCNFESCDEVMATTCVIKNCNFVSANDEAFVLPSGNTHKLEYCNFINNPDAWRIPNAGTYTCNGCKFINNDNDIDNTSGGSVTVNKENGADPITSTGDTTIQGSVPITITCKNEAGNAIEDVRVRIEKQSDQSLVKEGYTNASGIFSESYTESCPLDVKIIVRLKGYKNANALGQITDPAGLNVPFTMIKDPAVNLP